MSQVLHLQKGLQPQQQFVALGTNDKRLLRAHLHQLALAQI